jgi:hypothetical protein
MYHNAVRFGEASKKKEDSKEVPKKTKTKMVIKKGDIGQKPGLTEKYRYF